MSFVPIIFLFILTVTARAEGDDAVSLSFYVGFALQCMYIAYFGMVFYLFASGHNKPIKDKDGKVIDPNKKTHLFRILTKTGMGMDYYVICHIISVLFVTTEHQTPSIYLMFISHANNTIYHMINSRWMGSDEHCRRTISI